MNAFRILLVEDDPARIAWFHEHVGVDDMTDDIDVAIGWLETREYAVLFLDHDLGREPRAGGDIARWLVERPDVLPALKTICHSVNVVNGPDNVQRLVEAGRPAIWRPFPELAAAVIASTPRVVLA